MDDQLREFSCLLGDFTDTGCSVLSDLYINVFQAVQYSRENFCFDNNFGEIDRVFGDLGQTLTDVALELGIWVRNKSSKVWDGTLVNNCLGQFFGMLGDFR